MHGSATCSSDVRSRYGKCFSPHCVGSAGWHRPEHECWRSAEIERGTRRAEKGIMWIGSSPEAQRWGFAASPISLRSSEGGREQQRSTTQNAKIAPTTQSAEPCDLAQRAASGPRTRPCQLHRPIAGSGFKIAEVLPVFGSSRYQRQDEYGCLSFESLFLRTYWLWPMQKCTLRATQV